MNDNNNNISNDAYDPLLFENRRNARAEFREMIRALLTKLAYGSWNAHNLSSMEMLDIAFEEFFDISSKIMHEEERQQGQLPTKVSEGFTQ